MKRTTSAAASTSASARARSGRRAPVWAKVGFGAVALAIGLSAAACRKAPRRDSPTNAFVGVSSDAGACVGGSPSSAPGCADPSAVPRPGMVFVPPGVLRAGSPAERVPRVADEEMPGSPVELGGFYIDLLPWPNEPNAIPTSNVTRDEAEALCATKGKRLCSELEWERACKGPDNTTYEYGDAYRANACGTGTAIELAARRPTGEFPTCKSGYGVSEMHGGVWEWTSSAWGRGSRDASQGVLRGGNSVAGELVGRCANAIARAPSKKSPTMGFRCCAGPKNDAEVKLEAKGAPGITGTAASTVDGWVDVIGDAIVSNAPPQWSEKPNIEPATRRAWSWVPVANEELLVLMGCSYSPKFCGMAIASVRDGKKTVLVQTGTGRDLPELARIGDARHLRIRALDARGTFSREITYVYGRVELGDPKRL